MGGRRGVNWELRAGGTGESQDGEARRRHSGRKDRVKQECKGGAKRSAKRSPQREGGVQSRRARRRLRVRAKEVMCRWFVGGHGRSRERVLGERVMGIPDLATCGNFPPQKHLTREKENHIEHDFVNREQRAA